MAKYYVRYNDLSSQAAALHNLGRKMEDYESRLKTIANGMDTSEENMNKLREYVLSYSRYIPIFAARFQVMGNVVSEAERIYGLVESLETPKAGPGIFSYSSDGSITGLPNMSIMNSSSSIINDPSISGEGSGSASCGSNKLFDVLQVAAALGSCVAGNPAAIGTGVALLLDAGARGAYDSFSFDYGRYNSNGHVGFDSINDKVKDYFTNKNAYKEKDLVKEKNPDTKYAKEYAKIFGVSAATPPLKDSVVGLYGELSGDAGWAQGAISGGILVYEAYAQASAGLYVFDRDGNKMLAPSVSALAGASFSLFTGNASGSIGLGDNHQLLGLGGNVEASVGKVAAEARASFSILGESGIQAKLSGSLEAVAAEISGKAGVTVLGVGVGVNASLKVGIGVSADIGYTDGVFKFKVGAALGIGFSIGFDINVGAAVNAVCGAAQSVLSAVGDAVVEGAKAVGNALAEGAKAVGNAVVDGLNAVGDFFSKW